MPRSRRRPGGLPDRPVPSGASIGPRGWSWPARRAAEPWLSLDRGDSAGLPST